MTAGHIFKMELFKYLRDKTYLMITGILAIINVFITIYFTYILDSYVQFNISTGSGFFGFMMIFTILSIFANVVFMFLYPFHLMSMDYRNNVMSMLVSSGVNRTRLFFAKIGATLLWSIGISVVLVFFPALIILLKLSQLTDIQIIVSSIVQGVDASGVSMLGLIVSSAISYINSLVIIATAVIMLKGNNSTFFLFIGLTMLQSVVISLFNSIPNHFDFSVSGMIIFSNLLLIASTLIFIVISLRIMKKQSL